MNPRKVNRDRLVKLTDLPNIGKASEADLIRLGIRKPQDLMGRSAYEMYDELCRITGRRCGIYPNNPKSPNKWNGAYCSLSFFRMGSALFLQTVRHAKPMNLSVLNAGR